MLAISALTLFLCTENFKANGIDYFSIRACARRHAHKTCFHCYCSNSVNFHRIKIKFNVFWEPLENPKQWLHFCYSAMATFALAGVFTYARIVFYLHMHKRVDFLWI